MKRIFLVILVILFGGCSEEGKRNISSTSGMKCGAGKCGANMFDNNAALAKKKKNILNQMREDDPRKKCVLEAKSTKILYDCVRDPNTKKMTLKCGEGKCGSSMPEKQPVMKCGAGKCGGGM